MRAVLTIAAMVLLSVTSAHAEDTSKCVAANQLMEQSNAAAARPLFEQCLSEGQLAPQRAALVHMNLGAVAIQLQDWAGAIREYDAAEKVVADSGQVIKPDLLMLYNRAYALLQTGDLARGREDLDYALEALEAGEVIRNGPTKADLLGMRAQARVAAGDVEGAAADLDAVAIVEPARRYDISVNKAVMFSELHRLDDAAAAAQAAIAIDADRPPAYNSLCIIYADMNKPDEAKAACDKALTLAPDVPAVQHSAGYAAEHAGKLGLAEKYYKRAMEMSGGTKYAADLERVRKAQ